MFLIEILYFRLGPPSKKWKYYEFDLIDEFDISKNQHYLIYMNSEFKCLQFCSP